MYYEILGLLWISSETISLANKFVISILKGQIIENNLKQSKKKCQLAAFSKRPEIPAT